MAESPKRKRDSQNGNSRNTVQLQLHPWVDNGISNEGDTVKEEPSFKVNLKKKKLTNSNATQGSRLLRSFRLAQKEIVSANNEKKQGVLSFNLREELKKTREQMAESWSKKSQSSNDSSEIQGDDIDSEAGTCSKDNSTDKAGLKDPNRVYKSKDSKEDSSDDDFDPSVEEVEEEGLQDTSDDDNNSGNTMCNDINAIDDADKGKGIRSLSTGTETNQDHNENTENQFGEQSEDAINAVQDITQDTTTVAEGRGETHESTNANHVDQNTETINTDQDMGQENNSVTDGRVILNGDDQNNNDEDDINTIASDQTFTHQNLTLPQWFRFRLIVKIPQLPVEVLAQQQRGETIPEEYQDNDKRLLNVLKKYINKINIIMLLNTRQMISQSI